MSFVEALWDGFEKVVSKVDLNIKTCKDYLEWFNKRQRIERDYGEKLHELCKIHPGGKQPSIDKQEKTLKDAMLSMTESGLRVALKHVDVATKLTNEIIKPLELAIKANENDRKRIYVDGCRRIKIHQDSVSAATKAHEIYVKASKESEAAKEQYLRAEAEIKVTPEPKKAKLQQNLAKYGLKRQQCIDKANQMELAYKAAVQAANDAQQKLYREEMPVVLKDLLKLIEGQFRCLETASKNFLNMQRDFPPEHAAGIDMMNTAINTDLNWNNDLQDFIDASRTNAPGPVPMEFITYEGKTPDAPTEASAPASPASPATTTTTTATTTTTTTAPAVTPVVAPAPATTVEPTPVTTTEPTQVSTPAPAATTTTTSAPAPASTTEPTTTTTTTTSAASPTVAKKTESNLFDGSDDLFGASEKKKDADPVENLFG